MDLDELLGIDPTDPQERQIEMLVTEDEDFLNELRKHRIHNGMTQRQVAEILGVSPSAIAHIESGDRDPRLSTLRRYAFAVGATYSHDVKPAGWSGLVGRAMSTLLDGSDAVEEYAWPNDPTALVGRR